MAAQSRRKVGSGGGDYLMRIKRTQLCDRLGETDYGIDQLIKRGILAKGTRLTPTSHPFWTERQVEQAEMALRAITLPNRVRDDGSGWLLSEKIRLRLRASAG